MPARQVSLIRRTVETLAKMIVEDPRLARKQTQEFELLLGNSDISDSPVSTSFEIELPIQNKQSDQGFLESRPQTVDDLEAEPDEPPQFAPSIYADIDVAAITADMPGTYPADRAQETSPVASDEFERRESSFFNEVVSVQVNVSQSYSRNSGHLASETMSITHQFLPQQASSGLEQLLALPPIPSAIPMIETAEIPPADLSSEQQITDAQNAFFVVSPIRPKTILESSATPATEIAHEQTGFRENFSSDTTPSPQNIEEEFLAVDQKLSVELPPFNEENHENARHNIQASDLAAAEVISADLVDGNSQGDAVEVSGERYQSSIDPLGPSHNVAAAQLAARKILQPNAPKQKSRELSKGNLASPLPMNIFQSQGQRPAADPGPAIETAGEYHKINEVSGVSGTRDRPICLDSPEKGDKDIPKPTIETDEASGLSGTLDMLIYPDSPEKGDENILRPAAKIKADRHSCHKVTGSFSASSTRIRAGTFEEDDSDTPKPEKKFDAYHHNDKEISGSHNAPTPGDLIPQTADIFHRPAKDVSKYENMTSNSDEKELNSADENTCNEYNPSSTCSEVSEPDSPSHHRRGFRETHNITARELHGLRSSRRRRQR